MTLPTELNQSLKTIQTSIQQLTTSILNIQQQQQQQPINNKLSFDQLTHQFKQDFIRIDNQLDEIELLADESEDESSRTKALEILEGHRNHLTRLRASFRTISLDLKRAISNNTLQSSRVQLLSGTTPKARPSNTQEALISASSDVTQSLRNTLEIMRQELDRSVMSTHLLEQQTATLQLTSQQYMSFGELIKTSRALIGSLKRADLIDRILLTAALIFFGMVCIYILKKRILDRGLSLLSTILSPLTRTNKIINRQDQALVTVNSNGQAELLTATAATATATALAFIPNLIPSDLPSPNPINNQPNQPPITSTPTNPSIPQIPEIELAHQEL